MKFIFVFVLFAMQAHAGSATSFVLGPVPRGNSVAQVVMNQGQANGLRKGTPNRTAAIKLLKAQSNGFTLTNNWGSPQLAETKFLVNRNSYQGSDTIRFKRGVVNIGGEIPTTVNLATSEAVQKYLLALSERKGTFIWFMRENGYPNLTNELYNKIAALAFAIMGQESEFYQGKTFVIKESQPGLTEMLRDANGRTDAPSRGPNQIKSIPRLTAKYFAKFPEEELRTYPAQRVLQSRTALEGADLSPDHLMVPAIAAMAAMTHLLMDYTDTWKLGRKYSHPEMNTANIFDYIPFVYKGSAYHVQLHTGVPQTEPYQKNLREYLKYLVIMEKPLPAPVSAP